MGSSGLTLLALAVIFSIATFLALNKNGKDARLRRLGPRHKPARPSTPSIEEQASAKPLASSVSGFVSAFPPLRRDQLKKMKTSLPLSQQKALGDLLFDQKKFERSLLGFEEDYRAAQDSKFSYSGFSVREIRALGDFPDYASLSEVPLPRPYEDFEIDKAIPRPYRPLRWAYHQTMALTKLEPDWWIELENTYKARIAQRQGLYAKHGEANKILGTMSIFAEKHPLLILLDNVPEDFCIVLRHPETGIYHFRAGVICSSLGWNVASKIGLKLHEVHEPVPDYKEKMQFSMDRYFSKMSVSKPIQRGSWSLEVDQPLYMPPGDPQESYRDYQDAGLTRGRLHFRVDWQTLRRLPLSGGVVFGFKGLFTPLEEFRDEPYVPSLFLKVLREGNKNIIKYKNTWHTEHVAIPMLEEFEREQVDKGLVEKNWEPKTLEESPWFPGWEKKWHAQQGF
ncbi:hypothetical protein DL771_002137 [Monosporascus sp. 5C6A]|nr:hypothetical protein DL771_002137 [Monosporascus sp. 5C6A]